jgi:hypothetical protein
MAEENKNKKGRKRTVRKEPTKKQPARKGGRQRKYDYEEIKKIVSDYDPPVDTETPPAPAIPVPVFVKVFFEQNNVTATQAFSLGILGAKALAVFTPTEMDVLNDILGPLFDKLHKDFL